MLKLLSWIWQFIQNIVALILIAISKTKCVKSYFICNEKVDVFFVNSVFGCGVSLGDFILLDYEKYYKYSNSASVLTTVRHEHGHQIQSRIFGPLYLIVIGFASAICNNLWDRLFHKKWTNEERTKWYYNRYPEKWADKLGNVHRWG